MKKEDKHKKIVITIDDLGMSPGTNDAIFDLYDNTILPIRASIMATTEEPFYRAIQEVLIREHFPLGLHLTLTYGKSYTCSPLLSNKEGYFNLTYFQILRRSKDRKFMNAVERELKAQIVAVMKATRGLTHLDSHQHIHSIPKINNLVLRLASEFHICEVRGFKERPFKFISKTEKYSRIFSSYFIKFSVIKFLGIWRTDRKQRTIYSILMAEIPMSVAMFGTLIKLSKSNCIEIICHVGNSELNKDFDFFTESEAEYHNSEKRRFEYNALIRLSDYIQKIRDRKKKAEEKAKEKVKNKKG